MYAEVPNGKIIDREVNTNDVQEFKLTEFKLTIPSGMSEDELTDFLKKQHELLLSYYYNK